MIITCVLTCFINGVHFVGLRVFAVEMFSCESIFNFSHTNEFIGKCFGGPEPSETCFGPKWGRWVYERDLKGPPGSHLRAFPGVGSVSTHRPGGP